MFTSKICVRVFSDSIGARTLERGIHMADELWYGLIEYQAHCSYFPISIHFLSFLDNFCHIFPRN